MPKISVLVPIFNVEKYLRECLDSVVNQTFRDLEIICLNDGSTDGSLKIIEEYARRDSRVVVIDKANSGYGDSMNQGLDRATGDFIAIIESDDRAELDMLEKLYEMAVANDVEVVKSEFFNYYTNPKKKGLNGLKSHLIRDDEAGRVIYPRNNVHIFFQQPSIWSALYRRDFLNSNDIRFLPTPGASYQDTAFTFKVWAAASRVFYTREAYLHYRRDSEGSSVNDPGKTFCVSEEYLEIERYLRERISEPTELLKLMRMCKWGGYDWNIERLNPTLAADFIRQASKEYRADYESGVFNFEYCDASRVREISELIHNPEMMIARKEASSRAKVSVIFPVYNVERFVRASLESILAQTLTEIEVIAIDDGSTDGSAAIVEEYAKTDPRIRFFTQENRGLSAARNVGIHRSQADYMAFLDSDDTFDPDAIERLYTAMTERDVELVVGSSRVEFEDGLRSAVEQIADEHYVRAKFNGDEKVTPELLRWVDVHVWNKLYDSAVVKDNNIWFPDGLKYEDAYFFNAYAWVISRSHFLDPNKPIHTYLRRHGAIMTGTFAGSNSAKDHIDIAFKLFEFLEQLDLGKKYGRYYLELLGRHIDLAMRFSKRSDHESIWRGLRLFLVKNQKELSRLDPRVYDDIARKVLPGYLYKLRKVPALQRIVLKLGMTVRAVMRRVTLRLSPTAQTQRGILARLDAITSNLQQGLGDQAMQLKELESQIEALSQESSSTRRKKD
ncbi:glycosyltransferase [Leucobacter insecticola]|uniref:Glycosyltransferase n=1 Tax=Leucobacter insecticola TaxID=2714934 RepID=A0A6G8FHF3_9MICO|nr:glycosyltransferase [Leucobacter insecticola]QIM15890.1 glycosyltransferase [Leucobacter insecticola]